MSGLLLAAVLVLLLVSATFTAAVTATFSIGASRARTLLEEGFGGGEQLARLRARAGSVQPAVELLTGVLNLAAVALGLLAGRELRGGLGAVAPVWMTAATLAITVLAVLLVGQILPRAIAARQPIRTALATAPLLLGAERWIRLLLWPLLRLELLLAGRDVEDEVTPVEREVLEMSALGQEEGIVDVDEHLLVERAFRLDELTAWDVMTPRVDVFAWPDSLQLRDIIDDLGTVPYSRVPVYGDSIDDVTGILYVREGYETFVSGRQDVPLSRISREPFFVPGSLSLAQLLRDFQARRIHMGIVADEFGGTDGIVTLEDVLEELVGEIVDETDVEDEPLMRISRDELVAEGGVDLREINYAFNVSLPQLEHRSLNGFILEELGSVPARGEAFERAGVEIEILEATDTQVLRARLRKLQTEAAEPEDAERT